MPARSLVRLLLLLSAPAAWAERGAVVVAPGSDPVASGFLAEVLLEELASAGHLEARMGDPAPLRGCSLGEAACLALVASASDADVVFLVQALRSEDQARLVLTRFVRAAATVQSSAVSVLGSPEGLAFAARSRVRRFLAGRPVQTRGALLVRSTPRGARILLDGEEAGLTPRVFDGLFSGPHLVQLRRQGNRAATRTALVSPGSVREVVVALSRRDALISLPAPRTPTLVTGGASLVLVAVAGVAAGYLQATRDEYAGLGEPTTDNVADLVRLREEGRNLASTANALLVASGAALLTAGWLYYRDASEAADGAR